MKIAFSDCIFQFYTANTIGNTIFLIVLPAIFALFFINTIFKAFSIVLLVFVLVILSVILSNSITSFIYIFI